jgi:hypothetical protein
MSAPSSCSSAALPVIRSERQFGWLYPKMTRMPRSVSEVLRVFETVRPRLAAAAQAPKNL